MAGRSMPAVVGDRAERFNLHGTVDFVLAVRVSKWAWDLVYFRAVVDDDGARMAFELFADSSAGRSLMGVRRLMARPLREIRAAIGGRDLLLATGEPVDDD